MAAMLALVEMEVGHAAEGSAEAAAFVAGALRVVRTPTVEADLGEAGAMAVVLRVFADPALPEGLREDAAATLSALCRDCDINRERLRAAGGVPALQASLAALATREPSLPAGPAVAALDCAWTCLVPDRKSLARFLALEGVETVLGLLEVGNPAARPVALSCLADMLANPKAHRFFHSWASPLSHVSAASLLLSLWREQEAVLGVSTAEGVMDGTLELPLKTQERIAEWKQPPVAPVGVHSAAKQAQSAAVADTMAQGMLLGKIHAVFTTVGTCSTTHRKGGKGGVAHTAHAARRTTHCRTAQRTTHDPRPITPLRAYRMPHTALTRP